jgi:hypothetical protein
MENLEKEIQNVESVVNHLNEEQKIIVLLNVASKFNPEEWQRNVVDFMKRMDNSPIK